MLFPRFSSLLPTDPPLRRTADTFLPAFLPRPEDKRRAAFPMLYPPVPISFLGLGLMGKPMAMNLIKSGYQCTVWNRTPSKGAELMSAGARLAKSPADAVRNAEAVVLMLEKGAVVTDLLFHQGVANACRERALGIDMSSIAPAVAEDHARLLMRSGLRSIDAPVSGGTVGAEMATLAIMAGGEA